MLPVLSAIIQAKLKEGYRCLYLNSSAMVSAMYSTLAGLGCDVQSEIDKGSLILSAELPATEYGFDPNAMLKTIEAALDRALEAGYKGLWASGDMSWELGSARDFANLLDYELELEKLFSRRKELHGICQYHRNSLPNDALRSGLLGHQSLVISDTLTRINPNYLKGPVNGQQTNRQLDDAIEALCRM